MATAFYPNVGFHFTVSFEGIGNENDTKFQQVQGLESSVEMKEFIEGGENRFKHNLPVRINYSDVTLVRGSIQDSEVTRWCLDAMEKFQFQPVNLMISMLNQNHEPLMSWYVHHAIPLKWKLADLNAEKSEVHIETLTLKIKYFNTLINN